MSDRIIGWGILPGMKKRHYFKVTYNGDAAMHCRYSTPSSLATSGHRTVTIDRSRILPNAILPKCKKCEKEAVRIDRILGSKR